MNDIFNREISRCLTCGKPLCQQGCPLHNDLPTVINFIRAGKYDKAVELIGHPFGEICGYVCPVDKQCQGSCVLGRKGDPVSIGTIERELFAYHPYVINRRGNLLLGKRYAVVGGGVSGLTFAAKVYEQGADVTVFERDRLLSTIKLIPDFRLPSNAVLRAEQSFLNKFEVEYRQIDGKELNSLTTQFDGVFVSTGLTLDYSLGVEGQALAANYRDCLKGNFVLGTVVVVGGGNSAIDCARFARSLGCRTIVAYRRTEQDMPAFEKEIDDAKNEQVEFIFNVAPSNLRKHNGKLQLELAKTVSCGRGKLTVTDDVFTVDCDSVIAAIGSKFDGSILSSDNTDKYLQYSNVYLGGDANGGKLVVDAVADGLKIANMLIEQERKICL